MSTPPSNERIIINGISLNAEMFDKALKEELKNFKYFEPKVKKKKQKVKRERIEYSYSKRKIKCKL